MEKIKIANFINDINEIEKTLNTIPFNRSEAENIIRKHNSSDVYVAALNSPINATWISFEESTNQQMIGNLQAIQQILKAELAKELNKK